VKDRITVAESYCLACQGECTNDDPENFDHMMVDWDALTGGWLDRGASPAAVWAFLASVLLGIARENDLEWAEVSESLELAWKKGSVFVEEV
jgi:hypothetical protein